MGIFSEQEGESKHATVNAELRSLACMKDQPERLRLVMEREELRSVANKTYLIPQIRLCKICTTKDKRFFL